MEWLGYYLPSVFVNDISGAISLQKLDDKPVPFSDTCNDTKTTHQIDRIGLDPRYAVGLLVRNVALAGESGRNRDVGFDPFDVSAQFILFCLRHVACTE